MKQCTKCKLFKSKSEFNKDKVKKDRLYSQCKQCVTARDKVYRQNNKTQINIREREYYKINNIKINTDNKKWNQNNPEKYILDHIKSRAKKENIACNLTTDDIIIPAYCPYLGVKLDKVYSKSPYAPSIDRIDSSKYYVRGNVQIISVLANCMKSNATQEELNAFSYCIQKQNALKYVDFIFRRK